MTDHAPPHPVAPAAVELRLIGTPTRVDAALGVLPADRLIPGRRKPTRDGDGRVIQYALLTVPAPREATRP